MMMLGHVEEGIIRVEIDEMQCSFMLGVVLLMQYLFTSATGEALDC